MVVLVTGAAGFIGYHTSEALLARGHEVVGVDIVNDYYDVGLKEARSARLARHKGFRLERVDIADRAAIDGVFARHRPKRVINLAAQAGVRYAETNPYAYGHSNLTRFLNILEASARRKVEHLVYASSSSVYGANTTMPFSVHDNVDHPLSLYAATKKANEVMAHSYAHIHRLPVSGLRFLTVYGPWGRPDMALFIYTRKILAGKPIDVFNNGHHARDFTYIDDIVEGAVRTLDHVAEPDPGWSGAHPDPSRSLAPYRLYNIGNNRPVELMHFIGCIEEELGRTAEKRFLPMMNGDVPATCADVDDLTRTVGFKPRTPIEDGIRRFIAWYSDYYQVGSR